MTPEERYERLDRCIEAIAMNLDLTVSMAQARRDVIFNALVVTAESLVAEPSPRVSRTRTNVPVFA
jgi:hypothetical protein